MNLNLVPPPKADLQQMIEWMQKRVSVSIPHIIAHKFLTYKGFTVGDLCEWTGLDQSGYIVRRGIVTMIDDSWVGVAPSTIEFSVLNPVDMYRERDNIELPRCKRICALMDEELLTHAHSEVRNAYWLRMLVEHPEYKLPRSGNLFGELMVKRSTDRLVQWMKASHNRHERDNGKELRTVKNILRDRKIEEEKALAKASKVFVSRRKKNVST